MAGTEAIHISVLPAYNSGPYTAPTTGLSFHPETTKTGMSTKVNTGEGQTI